MCLFAAGRPDLGGNRSRPGQRTDKIDFLQQILCFQCGSFELSSNLILLYCDRRVSSDWRQRPLSCLLPFLGKACFAFMIPNLSTYEVVSKIFLRQRMGQPAKVMRFSTLSVWLKFKQERSANLCTVFHALPYFLSCH